ncbi:hypothetical protein JHK82_030955 [Glycine max]|uniref:Uncharacterized protein n=1 Tax=Glycine max TaxID=3847 RepID=K7LPQ5_SOYBN|nr:hypothetical protein JHK85_031600 [Glycine max]KAG4994224.1 hypothetical protein JHK86_031051 [Glycine max]KAG5124218.1 hypothetical protein JHK82_030955 [Glycine max]KAG5145638.1 hypothetical protein JHK84_031181 [Glycine max]KAH1159122.1 hypothetical protein GYH30_031033 [Glycine max]
MTNCKSLDMTCLIIWATEDPLAVTPFWNEMTEMVLAPLYTFYFPKKKRGCCCDFENVNFIYICSSVRETILSCGLIYMVSYYRF